MYETLKAAIFNFEESINLPSTSLTVLMLPELVMVANGSGFLF